MSYPSEEGAYCFGCMAILPYSSNEKGQKVCKHCNLTRMSISDDEAYKKTNMKTEPSK